MKIVRIALMMIMANCMLSCYYMELTVQPVPQSKVIPSDTNKVAKPVIEQPKEKDK